MNCSPYRYVLLLILLSVTLRAQQGGTFSTGFGYEQSQTHNYEFPAYLNGCDCDHLGWNNGYGAHLTFSSPLGFLPLDLSMRLSGVMTQGGTNQELPRVLINRRTMVEQVIEQEQWFSMLEARFELATEYRFGFGLRLRGGMSFGYRTLDSFRTVLRLIEPLDARFTSPGRPGTNVSDDGRTHVLYSGPGPSILPLNYAAIASLSFPIPIADDLAILPELGIRYELETGIPADAMQWPRANFAGSMALLWHLPMEGSPATDLPDPPPASAAIPPIYPPPQPSIDLYSIGENGTRMERSIVTTRRILHRRTIDLPSHAGRATTTSEWIEERAHATPVEIEPDLAGERGIRRWTIRLLRNGTLVAEQRSDEPEQQGFSVDMLLRDLKAGELPAPLVAEFEVEDSVGTIVSARDELTFVLGNDQAETVDSSVATYIFFPSDMGEMEDLDNRLHAIAEETDRRATITIAPLMPGIDTEWNFTAVAQHITELFKAILPDASVRILPDGSGISDIASMGNEGFPENRIIHDGIVIVVSQRSGD